MSDAHSDNGDPCAITSAGRWAFAWAFFVILGGTLLAYKLCAIDRRMYDTGAPYLDFAVYKENRAALSSIASEGVDERRQPNFRNDSLTTKQK